MMLTNCEHQFDSVQELSQLTAGKSRQKSFLPHMIMFWLREEKGIYLSFRVESVESEVINMDM